MDAKQVEVKREGILLDVSTMPMLYGCCGLFDPCMGADLMSLSFHGSNPFLDWIGWQASLECLIRKAFLTWVAPEPAYGFHEHGGQQHYGELGCTPGYLADPCDKPNGAAWGGCDFELRDFARLRRHGPVRDVTYTGVKYCDLQPRYRLDGSVITDDREFDMRIVTEVLIQDLARMIITGNAATPGQFNGLQQLVKTGYTNTQGQLCSTMDSIVIDWNGNPFAGGAGITWNGLPVGDTFNFVDVLLAAYRRIKTRLSWAPSLSARNLRVGDMVLVGPTSLINCILDSYTCWSVCSNSAVFSDTPNPGPIVGLNSFEGRRFRDSLNGGMFGFGRIFLDGFEIPLIAYDWGLQNSPTLGDLYFLTGSVGAQKVLNGQYLDMNTVPLSYPELKYTATDGGRLLTWTERDETCARQNVEMRPRLLSYAPWTNVRFQDVQCAPPGGAISADPCDSSFYPESSFIVQECEGSTEHR